MTATTLLPAHCEPCNRDFKDARGLSAHRRHMHVEDETVPQVVIAPVVSPVILPNMRRANLRVSVVGRNPKMLRPICATCQQGQAVPEDWWKTCPHDKYTTVGYHTETVRKYEDVVDAEGSPTGQKRLLGTEEISTPYERPNWVQPANHPRIGSGVLVNKKRRRYGFIFPEELRSAEYPNGIANPCDFRDCFWQEGVKEYRWGRFCRKVEAQLVGHDLRMDGGGGALEIGDTQKSQEKQRTQLEAVPV